MKQQPRRILFLNASPQSRGHTQQILDAAASTLDSLSYVQVEQCSFSGRTILPLNQCSAECNDDFLEIAGMWQAADGILLGAPVYTFGPPSSLYAFIERLRALQSKMDPGAIPAKPIGLISQGGAPYSGAEVNANLLRMLALSIGCVPVAGDMPGFSQAIIGQVGDQADPDPALMTGSRGLAVRVVEMVDILSAGKNADPQEVKILAVTAGSGTEAVKQSLVDALFEGAAKAPGCSLKTDVFSFAGKEFAPCLACTQYCSRDLECIYKDGMQEYRQKWLQADAVIWLVGADEIGIEPSVIAAMDRMNQVRFETHFAVGQPHMPRYSKAMGVLAFGSHPYRIASAVRFLRQIALLYQHVIIPQELYGGCGVDIEQAAQHKTAVLGEVAASMASVLNAGLSALDGKLSQEYYPSTKRYGLTRGSQ
jgi:multimeric flavodoxin WrbA